MSNQNLFVALRDAFPADLDRTAVETDNGLSYSWRDLERATAMVANLLDSLDLPPASRIGCGVVSCHTDSPRGRIGSVII